MATTRESLHAWADRLESLGIAHSEIVEASRGYALGFRDPDGLQIRLYADGAEIAAKVGGVVSGRSPRGSQPTA